MTFKEIFANSPWWGKILGGFFGYLVYGPLGGVIGVLIGAFFDRGYASYLSNPHLSYFEEKRKAVQKIFFEATFAIMGHIAKSDGRVSEHEIEIAKKLMQEMRLNREQKSTAKKLFNYGKSDKFDANAFVKNLRNACKDNKELLKLFIDIQYRAAQVDGLTMQKILCLNRVLQGLGFAPLHQQYRFQEDFHFDPNDFKQEERNYQHQAYAEKGSSIDHAYALLEIQPTASKQEVKRAYRRLMSRNHPDKLTAQGLPPQMIKMATDKTQKIIQAYQMICELKGW